MIDATATNFEQEVIAASTQIPVLVDFWADWCAPCKSLGPILEKLEVDYGGRFKLVKINADTEQQLSAMFGVRSLPTCVLLINGQPVDGFMGLQPEGAVREFLDKHVPSEAELATEHEEEKALEAMAEGHSDDAVARLQAAIAQDPNNHDARFDLTRLLLQLGQTQAASDAYASAATAPPTKKLHALMYWFNAIKSVAACADSAGQNVKFVLDLDARIAANKRDFEARFLRAEVLLVEQTFVGCLDELLEILMRDRTWNDDAARKAYIAVLEIMEPVRPKLLEGAVAPHNPQADLVASYRRRLSMVVLS